ncbi:MAG: hypothetical protein IJD73_00020 [Clostridia bacterium]|nr:hypothetical protein [Clostridia bacterium]
MMKAFGILKKILCCVTVIAMLICSLASCAGKGKPLMKLDKTEFSVNLFELYLSRMKGMLCSSAYLGETGKDENFWETWIDVENRKTYNTHYTELVLDNAKSSLAAIAAFDELGLKLPDFYIEEIDAELEDLVKNEANGSKTAFNATLAEYGANYDILREAYIIEAKISYLSEHLFGKNGSKVGKTLIDEYYVENYARFKQVFLYGYEFLYDEDENGDRIYYREDNSKISYDTSKTAKLNSDGSYATDKNGDRIYVYTDSDGKERIAYKKDGAATKQLLDSDGEPLVRYYEDGSKEMQILDSDANAILAEAEKGDFVGFDAIVKEHGSKDSLEDYPDGYYVSRSMNYEAVDVVDEVFDMEIGEVKKIPTEFGIHIVMRYELDDDAYSREENEDIFISTKTGTYIFMEELVDELLGDYLKEYKDKITVDEKLLATVDIKRAGVNFYY